MYNIFFLDMYYLEFILGLLIFYVDEKFLLFIASEEETLVQNTRTSLHETKTEGQNVYPSPSQDRGKTEERSVYRAHRGL